jgi:hypothetical protein
MTRQKGREPQETEVERGPVSPDEPPREDEERGVDSGADEEE